MRHLPEEYPMQLKSQRQVTRVSLPRPTNGRGLLWIFGEATCTAVMLALSYFCFHRIGNNFGWVVAWLASQMALGLLFFQWFVLMHGCGHRALFANRTLNDVFGHIASIFCLVPYSSWQYIHAQHHRWVGWMDKDPTTRALTEELPPVYVQRFMNFCWRFWIPIFSLVFALSTFWNVTAVAVVAPSPRQRRRVLFSVAFLIAVYGYAIALAGTRFLEVWGVAFLCFLMIGDPILLSQHVHLPLRKTNGAKVKPFALAVQDLFARTIILPPWIERWVVLHFTTHGVHHAHPQVAHYDLAQIQFSSSHAIRWSEWLRAAKRIPVTQLLYQSSEDTGVFI
jgi:acyl-lipid omega-6 desaturase (Delta-12 desaturase)